jgi:quaternary ammonium compound-resistance protein SugE
MAWMILVVAGLFEVGLVMGLNFSEGFTKLLPSVLMVVSGGISFYLLSAAMRSIPVGTANALRMAGIAVVLGGVLMLKLAEG